MTTNPLYDSQFLLDLFTRRERENYAKVILLDFDELPKADFSGRVTQGSVNLDGNSAVRRTCSLSIAAELSEADSYMWSLDSKFKLEIGLKNKINSNYPDIIWFPMGIYFITSFTINRNTSTTSISISGKDKMAMLTGDLGGVVPALTWDFGSIEITDEDGNITVEKYLIKNIIRELVHEFAKEPFQNIIINDLEDTGLELLQYNYSQPMYLIRDEMADIITQFTLKDNQGTYYKLNEDYTLSGEIVTFKDSNFEFDTRNSLLESTPTYFTTIDYLPPDTQTPCERPFTCIKAEKGDTIGYRSTDLVYAGDLIASVGESVVSVLDKIKNMLGDYEYFYNLEGQFVFQRKRVSLYHPWNQLSRQNEDTEQYVDLYADEYDFTFDENTLVSSFSNNPNIGNVKNDFVVWGTKNGTSSKTQTPVHCRYAIQTKPKYYKTIGEADGYDEFGNKKYKNQKIYITDKYTPQEGEECKLVDWREIIYQMALDYRKHMHDSNTSDAEFYSTDALLPQIAKNNPDFYPDGNTGYEHYYTDMEGFWRLLYDPNQVDEFVVATNMTEEKYNLDDTEVYVFTRPESGSYSEEKHYYMRKENSEVYYYAGEITEEQFNNNIMLYYLPINPKIQNPPQPYSNTQTYFYKLDGKYYPKSATQDIRYWNKDIFTNPEGLLFWIDFIDVEANSDLSQYAIDNIGLRSVAKNDTAVKAVIYKDVPNVLFVENKDAEEIIEIKEKNTGYTILPLNESLSNVFIMSVQGKSAKDEIDSMLYNKACCNESITINSVPIYSIEPNSKIYVKDTKAGINGAYMADRFTINLAYNGMMNITATKIIDSII